MRIFFGTHDIAGQIPLFALGFRTLGHKVTTGVHIGHSYKFDTSLTYDLTIDLDNPIQAKEIIQEHDVFMFQFGFSLLRENQDYKMIRRAGKKIISFFNGDDIRYWPAYETQYSISYTTFTGEEPPYFWQKDNLKRVLPVLRRAELYADMIISHPSMSQLALRPYQHFFTTVNLSNYQFHVPEHDIPVVVHAPSDKAVKGTKNILAALDQLKNEGVQFELHLLHGVPNSDVLKTLTNADCVIDQVLFSHGLFALEAMASGCAVAVGHYPYVEPFAKNIPIHGLHPETLKKNLQTLLTNKELRLKLIYAGRAHVEQYHDTVKVCNRILERLTLDNNQPYDYLPHFYAKEFILPEGIHIPKKYLEMTDKIITRRGLPHDSDPLDMARRGLISPVTATRPIPCWEHTPIKDISFSTQQTTFTTSTWHPTKKLPLLEEVSYYNLFTLFPKKNFSLNLANHLKRDLQFGSNEQAILRLMDHISSNTHIDETLIAALGILLYGQGNYDIAKKMFTKSAIALSIPLIKWILGLDLLMQGNTAQALQLLLPVIKIIPETSKGNMALKKEQPGAIGIISWLRPSDISCEWYSPAALTPDWCNPINAQPLWYTIMFLCLMNGYHLIWGKDFFENIKSSSILYNLLSEK